MKKILALLGISILSIPSVFAVDLRILEDLFGTIFEIGSFVWVTDVLSATKFAIFIILFAVLYGVLNKGLNFTNKTGDSGILGGDKNTKKKTAGVIAFAMSALTVIFIPNDAAMAFGEIYSAIAAIILVGLPVGGLIYLGYAKTMLPSWLGGADRTAVAHGSVFVVPQNKKWILHGIRLLLALMAFALVAGIAQEYGFVTAVILPLFWRSNK